VVLIFGCSRRKKSGEMLLSSWVERVLGEIMVWIALASDESMMVVLFAMSAEVKTTVE